MSERKHKKTLEAIFAHPINTNIDWKDVEHLFEHLGFEVDLTKKHHAKVKAEDGSEVVVILPHHGHTIESKDEIVKIRHFLEEKGITPDTFAD